MRPEKVICSNSRYEAPGIGEPVDPSRRNQRPRDFRFREDIIAALCAKSINIKLRDSRVVQFSVVLDARARVCDRLRVFAERVCERSDFIIHKAFVRCRDLLLL
jgi:hypothetical protein